MVRGIVQKLTESSSSGLTVNDALRQAAAVLATAGIDNARYEAVELMMFAASMTREDIFREPEQVLTERASVIFDKAVSLRALRRPLAYITGERWFYGRPFKINRAVLIPRPETELIVEFVLEQARSGAAVKNIADIGTGSGCIAVTLAAELQDTLVSAVDLSAQALLLARKNVERHTMVDRVSLLLGDLLDPLEGRALDMIVSNPPYIAAADADGLMPEVRIYEPSMALWEGAGVDGTVLHRRLIEGAKYLLNPGGWLVMEVGAGQADKVAEYAVEYGYKPVYFRRDLANIERVVTLQWNP